MYAIDIDLNKIDLCKNNTEVYECGDNISFICQDFLKVNSKKIKNADTVFLSPPWGGIDYKSSSDYSLKKWITPDINDIIRKSKSLAENLIFYLPRNTKPEELFEILSEIYKDEEDDTLFAEVQILKSANKIKALLIFFGQNYNHVSLAYMIILDFCKGHKKLPPKNVPFD